MKTLSQTLSLVLVLFLVACGSSPEPSQAQETDPSAQAAQIPFRANEEPRVSPNAAVSQTIGTTVVTITYGRPYVKGREIFGGLVPYGQVWRTGANEATSITFSDDVLVEGEPVSAGTYGLFTLPGESEWAIIINDVAQQWGAFDYNESGDVLRVMTTPEEAPHQEMMTFSIEEVTNESAEVVLHWAEIRVPFTIQVSE